MSHDKLMEIYNLIYDHYGPQKWWPGDGAMETIIGAILTQNTNWTNVEKAIANLKSADCLSADKLHNMDMELLARLIRPAGYYNIKARRLKTFLQWLYDNYAGDISAIENIQTDLLREQLLAIKGIGPETADSILLYALARPVFVVDSYTCRILGRHGLIADGDGYEQVRDFFETSLSADVPLFNEYHALLVQVGKEFCKTKPKCKGCPLEKIPRQIEYLED